MKTILHHKATWILAAALSLSLILAAAHQLLGGLMGPAAELFQTASRPLREATVFLDQNASHWYGQAARYESLLSENQALREELSRLREEVRKEQRATRENVLLRELLELRQARQDLQFESARILSPSADNWSGTLTIDKGSRQGVALRQCVVDATGALVGTVGEVGSNHAIVYLLTDASFEMGGEAVSTGEAGLLTGTFSSTGEGSLLLTQLAKNTAVAPGDEVTTLSAQGVYPSGLLVGTVNRVEDDPSGLTRTAWLTPSVSLESLRQVFVITDYTVDR